MELDEEPTWEEINEIKGKLDSLDDMDRDNPEFEKILKECEKALDLAWNKMMESKFDDHTKRIK